MLGKGISYHKEQKQEQKRNQVKEENREENREEKKNMYCRKCGKEISEDMKFCSHCGAPQETPSTSAALRQGNEPKQKKKGFSKVVITGIAVAAMALLGQWVGQGLGKDMAESYVDNNTSESKAAADTSINSQTAEKTSSETVGETQSETAGETQSEVAGEANPEYDKIFSDRFIVHMPAFMMGDTAAFARVDADGTVQNIEWASRDDVITTMVHTLYVDISGLSEAEKQGLDSTVLGNFSEMEGLDFVTLSSNVGTNYYWVTLRAERLNEQEVLQTAIDNGIVEVDAEVEGALLSMELTRAYLLEDGFVEK